VDGVVEDPCTPKGYIYDTNSKNYSSGFLADESKLKGSLQAAGNFSKCRSATFALLKEGKGKQRALLVRIAECCSSYRFFLISYGCSFVPL